MSGFPSPSASRTSTRLPDSLQASCSTDSECPFGSLEAPTPVAWSSPRQAIPPASASALPHHKLDVKSFIRRWPLSARFGKREQGLSFGSWTIPRQRYAYNPLTSAPAGQYRGGGPPSRQVAKVLWVGPPLCPGIHCLARFGRTCLAASAA